MTYIHELSDWTELTWDSEKVAEPLAAVLHQQGRLLGKMNALGFDLRNEASLTVLTADVVKSSAIEGATLDPDEVRSSIARKLGLDVAGLPQPSRDVDGVVEMMLDATLAVTSDCQESSTKPACGNVLINTPLTNDSNSSSTEC